MQLTLDRQAPDYAGHRALEGVPATARQGNWANRGNAGKHFLKK
jgi:hypothetical protein